MYLNSTIVNKVNHASREWDRFVLTERFRDTKLDFSRIPSYRKGTIESSSTMHIQTGENENKLIGAKIINFEGHYIDL